MTLTTPERWLPVVSYEGYYEVSDLGRVRSVDRTIVTKTGAVQRYRGRILKLGPNHQGYLIVELTRNGRGHPYTVHRLVMAAFVGPRLSDRMVCHNNGDPSDNRLTNLRYGTASDNMRDKRLHGTDHRLRNANCPHGHPYAGPNLHVRPHDGARACRSCVAAASIASKMRRRGQDPGDVRAIANDYYERLTRAA